MNFFNQLRFERIMVMSLWPRFFGPPCMCVGVLIHRWAACTKTAKQIVSFLAEQNSVGPNGELLAQCWFPGLPFPMLKYEYIFHIKCTEVILSNSTQELLWFEITKMLIAV